MKMTARLTLFAILPSLLLGPIGCETMRDHRLASGAAIGAAAGALAGGIIGNQSDNKWEGAAIGGALGAAIGAGTGAWLNRRASRFESVSDSQTVVETYEPIPLPATPNQPQQYVPEHITLRLSDTMLFSQGSSTISPGGAQKLNQIATVLNENPNEMIRVVGHASTEGAEDRNMALSVRRAEAVANYLASRGVSPSRMTVIGLGESYPLVPNEQTEADRAMNRRVEIEVYPPQGM